MRGIIYQSTGLWYRVKLEDGEIISSRLAGKQRLIIGKLTNPIAVGDRVNLEFSVDKADIIIKSIEERKNYLIRKSPKKTDRSHILASNIDLGIFVFTKKFPRTSLGFLDRFLVCCAAYEIPALILFHKWDLYDQEERKYLDEIRQLYTSLNYPTEITSTLTSVGMDAILKSMEGKTSLFFGHSGAGKTSILNHLFPNLDLKTSEVSDFTKKGKHTTTFAQMFDLSPNTSVIDIPGIKEFALEDGIENYEITQYFPEIREASKACKFYNCVHINEPNCKVLEHLAEGKIHESRYKSYLGLVLGDDFKRK